NTSSKNRAAAPSEPKLSVQFATGPNLSFPNTGLNAYYNSGSLRYNQIIRNSGTQQVTSNFYAKMELNGEDDAMPQYLAPINAGLSQQIQINGVRRLKAGYNFVRVKADANENVRETSESDNILNVEVTYNTQTNTISSRLYNGNPTLFAYSPSIAPNTLTFPILNISSESRNMAQHIAVYNNRDCAGVALEPDSIDPGQAYAVTTLAPNQSRNYTMALDQEDYDTLNNTSVGNRCATLRTGEILLSRTF
ncbi:hypothetical protein HY605_05970, partial [Candidatus Peregrinibacteria bacterium]|nr:hypothetical protein [Candidatus Peregrinibacteria bacterium]